MTRYPAGSLMSFLAEVPDPRGAMGLRHPLAAVLAHACCAMLCGARGYAAIAQWGRDQPIEFMHRLGYRRAPASYGAIQGLLSRLDPAALEAALARWVAHLLGGPAPGELRATALDGKVCRGSLTPLAPAVHLLAVMDQATGGVLRQVRLDPATNEHKTAPGLLEGLVLKGRVVTGDAAFCQRDLSRQIVEAGGHYLWKVADNQPTLRQEIGSAFEPAFSPPTPGGSGPATSTGRGSRTRTGVGSRPGP